MIGTARRRRTADQDDARSSPSRARWNRIAGAVLIALAVATVVQGVIAAGSEAPADVVGGDYPAFHGAGGIALEGEWDARYDIERQAESQRGLHADEGDVWYFAYPPQVAAVYAPFATLPYSLAYLLHTAVMAGLLLGIAVPMSTFPLGMGTTRTLLEGERDARLYQGGFGATDAAGAERAPIRLPDRGPSSVTHACRGRLPAAFGYFTPATSSSMAVVTDFGRSIG